MKIQNGSALADLLLSMSVAQEHRSFMCCQWNIFLESFQLYQWEAQELFLIPCGIVRKISSQPILTVLRGLEMAADGGMSTLGP
jgi:hypothetical protein